MQSSKAVRAPSGETSISRLPAEEGLVVTDLGLTLIGADRGATDILAESHVAGAAGQEIDLTLPNELSKAFGTHLGSGLTRKSISFQVGKQSYSCRAFLVEPKDSAHYQPILAIHIRRDSSVSGAITHLAAEFHLSDREQQVLHAIATGLTSKEAAQRLNIRPSTVKTFLRMIMIKLGVSTRAGLVGKLLEYASDHSTN